MVARLRGMEGSGAGCCDSCGAVMTGEWLDGSELRCEGCGTVVSATAMSNGTWRFPPVFDEAPEVDHGE